MLLEEVTRKLIFLSCVRYLYLNSAEQYLYKHNNDACKNFLSFELNISRAMKRKILIRLFLPCFVLTCSGT